MPCICMHSSPAEECDHIISLAEPGIQRSGVVSGHEGGSVISDYRTSSGTFLARGQDAIIAGAPQTCWATCVAFSSLGVSGTPQPPEPAMPCGFHGCACHPLPCFHNHASLSPCMAGILPCIQPFPQNCSTCMFRHAPCRLACIQPRPNCCMHADIEQRIARWTLLPVGNGEGLQVLRYGRGQQYGEHAGGCCTSRTAGAATDLHACR